jgi:hypothetical protein
MAPSDQTKDTGEQAGKDQTSKRDDSTQRGQNDKLGSDGKTEGERMSDQIIREMEHEMGQKTDLPPMDGGPAGKVINPPPNQGPDLRPTAVNSQPDRLEVMTIAARGGIEGGGRDPDYVWGGGPHRSARDQSLPDGHSAAYEESRAAGDAMFQKFVKGAELRGAQAARSANSRSLSRSGRHIWGDV